MLTAWKAAWAQVRARFSRTATLALIPTTKGHMAEHLLEKREGSVENDNEHTTWVEYHHGGELVHRSVTIRLKQAVFGTGEVFSPWGDA